MIAKIRIQYYSVVSVIIIYFNHAHGCARIIYSDIKIKSAVSWQFPFEIGE